jgi:hypothetical protein
MENITVPKTNKARRTTGGLTLDELIRVVERHVPTDRVGELLQRLPERFYSKELDRFRPVTPAVLISMSYLDAEDGEIYDDVVASYVELVASDPSPAVDAWTTTPDGVKMPISTILSLVAKNIASLYSARPLTAVSK